MLIDRFLPEYDVLEHHEVQVDAPGETTYRAVKDLDLARSPVVRALRAVGGRAPVLTGAGKPARRLGLGELRPSLRLLIEGFKRRVDEALGAELV